MQEIPCAEAVGEGTAERRSGPGVGEVTRSGDGAGGVRMGVSPAAVVVMAVSFGLCAGYLDVVLIVLRKFVWNPEGYYRIARDFPWSVPAAHAALLLIPGLVLAGLSGFRPRLVSRRAAAWLLATLALWGALLRLPIYGACSLVVAGGAGRLVADVVAIRGRGWGLRVPAALLVVLGVLAAASSGWETVRESRRVAALPATPSGARNVLLIVWDTVRADHTGPYAVGRETTPELFRWAREGVVYQIAMAAAPWTFPSHSSLFTGRWPMWLNSQWKPRLDTPDPTVAEYLSSRGYQTAGFAANTNCCTYESGFERGFAHYEDYSSSPGSLFARTVPGRWLLEEALRLAGDYHSMQWVTLQSRDASGINEAFLGWLGRRRPDRPFFAFLNYFDAHDPFIPPPRFDGRFGIRPTSRKDYQFLLDYLVINRNTHTTRNLEMARDCYDDCIAYLDEQLGRLLDELKRRGVLEDTEVIITSDHGEAFGEHGHIGHSYGAHMEELRVPLVILSPGARTGQKVYQPVTLCDLPATIVDRVGLAEGSPFPGRSLASYWGLPPDRARAPLTSPALSEQANRSARMVLRPQAGPGGVEPGFRMSLVAMGHHYIRDGAGGEQLHDLTKDFWEQTNLAGSADHRALLDSLRAMLLGILEETPGSTEVEHAYLRDYREALAALVDRGTGGPLSGGRDRRDSPGVVGPSGSGPSAVAVDTRPVAGR